jgi:glucose-6-phosphate isomerase
MRFSPGFDIQVSADPLGFRYGPGTFGPQVESRSLDDIRMSLLDPECSGPDPVYAIAMDIGKTEHRDLLIRRHLLFGAVTYAGGRLGKEPVRSQGHVHRATRNNRLSPPEVYEVWAGEALIYVQEHVDTDPGRCFALRAGPGDVVIIPPGWGHAAISADPSEPLTFGAWCDRDYAFEYEEVRTRRGFPGTRYFVRTERSRGRQILGTTRGPFR